MNNVIIKVNNKEEYNETLDILSDFGIIWDSGQTIDSKNDKANSYDMISFISELDGVFDEKKIMEDEPVVCLIIERNKLSWEFLDEMIENYFDYKDYEMYTFKDFKKVYNI